jgi:hypothetical protein
MRMVRSLREPLLRQAKEKGEGAANAEDGAALAVPIWGDVGEFNSGSASKQRNPTTRALHVTGIREQRFKDRVKKMGEHRSKFPWLGCLLWLIAGVVAFYGFRMLGP